MEATLIDPSACSFRSCSQLGNSFPSLLLKHLLRFCRSWCVLPALPSPAGCPVTPILRLLINSLEAALIAAEGRFCCLLTIAQITCLSVTWRPW